METMEVHVEYVQTAGGRVHRRLWLEGVAYSAEQCNLDDALVVASKGDILLEDMCRRCMVVSGADTE